jgi:hypothetical protein
LLGPAFEQNIREAAPCGGRAVHLTVDRKEREWSKGRS